MSFGDWDMLAELERLRRDLNRMSGSLWVGRPSSTAEEAWTPAVDVYEQDGALVLLVDLPGVKREDIELTISPESVTVAGGRANGEEGTGIRLERPAGRFRRSFRIGMPVDAGRAQAVCRDGVLRITLPQAGPSGPARVRVPVE